jgi:hypothetical protein
MLNVRLAPLVALFALLPLKPRRTAPARVALVAAAMAGVAIAINAAREIRATVDEELGDLDGMLSSTTPGARLLMLSFDMRSRHMLFPPWLHVGAYHRVAKGGVSSFSFTELPHWPLRYREENAPPKKAEAFWEFHPCTFRNAVDGAYHDFVLVHGDLDPFRDEPPGPVFRRVARTRALTLYAKVPDQTWASSGERDRGPCDQKAELDAEEDD